MEPFFLIILILVIYLIFLAAQPRPPDTTIAPPTVHQVRCPRCGMPNLRSCPNCGTIIPQGTLHCPGCHITAANLPCRVCGTDLRNIP